MATTASAPERKRKILIVSIPIDSDENMDELANSLLWSMAQAGVGQAQVTAPNPDLADWIDRELDR